MKILAADACRRREFFGVLAVQAALVVLGLNLTLQSALIPAAYGGFAFVEIAGLVILYSHQYAVVGPAQTAE